MGGWMVECDGEFVTMPFGEGWDVPTLEGRFPNRVMLRMDEDHFKRGFEKHAIWAHGKGKYATLAYCGGELTIERHKTLRQAIHAKRTIDGSGCGGGCAKVHVIAYVDPTNSRRARQLENVRRYRDAQKAAI